MQKLAGVQDLNGARQLKILDKRDYIYLDYNATTPLCEEASIALKPYLNNCGRDSYPWRGNANSLYTIGRSSASAIEEARKSVARCLNCQRPSEIAFTSGATESIYLSLSGLFAANGCAHIIMTSIEHSAVINAAKHIAGKQNLILLKPDRSGFISEEALLSALHAIDKALVSIGYVNSEIGTIQDISKLAQITHEQGCVFHTDMTQAVGKIDVDLQKLDVDAASFSSHKFCGPTGVGGLYLKNKTRFTTPIAGGGQENGLRGGTQNVAGIVGMAAALDAACKNLSDERERLFSFKKYLFEEVPKIKNENGACKFTIENCDCEDFLPNLINIILPKIESEVAILRFDELGICVSGGSACSSHSLAPSATLSAIGIKDDEALCALRVTFGRYTTKEDIEKFLHVLKEVVEWKK